MANEQAGYWRKRVRASHCVRSQWMRRKRRRWRGVLNPAGTDSDADANSNSNANSDANSDTITTPTGINYNTSEYQNSAYSVDANAIAAYNAGATGQGVKIGIVDSGLNPSLSEFAGRIDPASGDVASTRGVSDERRSRHCRDRRRRGRP